MFQKEGLNIIGATLHIELNQLPAFVKCGIPMAQISFSQLHPRAIQKFYT